MHLFQSRQFSYKIQVDSKKPAKGYPLKLKAELLKQEAFLKLTRMSNDN